MLRKKYVPIDEKHHKSFSVQSVLSLKIFYFIFIKCRADHVHIESLYLKGY